MKFIFLINPISGGGQGKVIHQFLPEIMDSMGFKEEEWKAEFTQYEGMKEQILNALANTETLIAVGGDGTVSAVLSTMLASEFANKVKIGLIPLGTGNDLMPVNQKQEEQNERIIRLLEQHIPAPNMQQHHG